jgi:hypothetical protein
MEELGICTIGELNKCIDDLEIGGTLLVVSLTHEMLMVLRS